MKKYLLLLFVVLFGLLMLYGIFGLIYHSNTIESSSNEGIVDYYRGVLCADSIFLNQVAEAFVETKYNGKLGYNCQNSGGYHTLWDREKHIQLTDSFPKIRKIIQTEYPDARDSWYSYNYKNGFVFIYLVHSSLYNRKKAKALFIYSPNLNDLKPLFSEYKLYNNNIIPREPYNWLYQIDKNWYICSPGEWLASKI